MSSPKENIVRYYNETHRIYEYFWHRNSLHYGFWDEKTKNLHEAIHNQNQKVVEYLDLQKFDTVLDAGCGVGGVSVFLAETLGCHVTGITLSPVQLNKANMLKQQSSAESLLSFAINDYTKTPYVDESFTKIFAIESLCYSEKPTLFLREAYRLLKPGGKIIIMDGFNYKEHKTKNEQFIYQEWIDGWCVPRLSLEKELRKDFASTGFTHVQYHDYFEAIKPSRDIMYRRTLATLWGSWILWKLGIFSDAIYKNNIAAFRQKQVFRNHDRLATYGVFVAEK